MFARKRKVDLSKPPPKRRKSKVPEVEEISFDFTARQDYLTGFHKRKLQRAKHAKEQAVERERLEKIEARKRLREDRKAELERHVREVNAMLKNAEGEPLSDSGEGSDAEPTPPGIGEENPDREDDFSDHDKHTTVVVEAVGVTRDGLHRLNGSESEEADMLEKLPRITGGHDGKDSDNVPIAADRASKRIWSKEKPKATKKKRKNFRYESKGERKITRQKERSGGKAKAKSRKE